MSVTIPETSAWSHDDLFAMQRAILDELRARCLAVREPPPASATDLLNFLNADITPRKSMTERLRRTTFAGGKAKKPTLRVVGTDERPRELQWNAALESWG